MMPVGWRGEEREVEVQVEVERKGRKMGSISRGKVVGFTK